MKTQPFAQEPSWGDGAGPHKHVSETSRTCSLLLALPSEETGDQEKGPKTVVLDRQNHQSGFLGGTSKATLPDGSFFSYVGRLGNPRHMIPKELSEETNPATSVALGTKPFYMVNTPKETSQTEVSVGEDTENRVIGQGQAHRGRSTHPAPPEGFGQGTLGLLGVICSQPVQLAAVNKNERHK